MNKLLNEYQNGKLINRFICQLMLVVSLVNLKPKHNQ